MTKEEHIKNINDQCLKESWTKWMPMHEDYGIQVSFELSNVNPEHNIQIVEQLKEKVIYSRKGNSIIVDLNGIYYKDQSFLFSEIILTGIKIFTDNRGKHLTRKYSLVIGLSDSLIEIPFKSPFFYFGVGEVEFGHFISLYKKKHYKMKESVG